MKVSDILRVKGNTLYTASPNEPLAGAVSLMAERDIGSRVVMEHGDLVGMLTFRRSTACRCTWSLARPPLPTPPRWS